MRKPPLRSYQQPAASYVPVHGYPRAEQRGEHAFSAAVAFADGEESFADLFEASLKSPKKAIARRDPESGEVVSGEVVPVISTCCGRWATSRSVRSASAQGALPPTSTDLGTSRLPLKPMR